MTAEAGVVQPETKAYNPLGETGEHVGSLQGAWGYLQGSDVGSRRGA